MQLTRRLLLIAVLVFGQWLAVAHASEHHALAQKHTCSQCLHSQPLDTGAVTPTLQLDLVVDDTVVAQAPAVSLYAVSRHHYRSRAPPAHLAH